MSAGTIRLLVALALLLSGCAPALPSPRTHTAPSRSILAAGAERPVLAPQFGEMPLLFVPNEGQTDERVAYYIQGRDKTIYFTPQGVTFALTAPFTQANAPADPPSRGLAELETRPKRMSVEPAAVQRWAVKLDFVGANPDVRPVGQDKTEAVVSYFKGRPKEWRTGLPTYAKIVYPELWPGIDLVYYGTVNRLKYEFVVRPGADPGRIRLAYRGATGVQVNAAGQLEVTTPIGGFQDDTPVAYQEVDGRRVEVEVAYALAQSPVVSSPQFSVLSHQSSTTYGFRVGEYDPGRPLILDPAVLVYAGYIGGSGNDVGWDIVVDGAGNAYVTGFTDSTEATFPETVGPDLTHNGRADAFVAKVNAAGTALVYAGYIGGAGWDAGYGIAVDGAGNAYVTGYTESTEATFPETVGPDLTHNGNMDAFVAKVNAAGTALVYAGYIGGAGGDYGEGIAVDGVGNAYVTGLTDSTEATFPETVGPDLTHNGGWDAFVAKVKADGTGLAYAGYIGGSGSDVGWDIVMDGAGNAYVTGWTWSDQSTFPVAVGPDLTHNGRADAFVAKVNAAGTALAYAGYIGGAGWDYGEGIAVDGAGNAYVTGYTESTEATFPETVGPDLTYNGGDDAFAAKVGGEGGGGTTPAGALMLLAAPTIPTTHPLAATAQVRNTGASLRDFTLTLRLQQGGTTLDTRTFTLSLAAGSTAEQTADFGLRPAGRYRVEAILSAGGITLATQSRNVTATDPNAARIILEYAGDLKAAAHAELNDIAYLPSYALADEILDFGLDKIEEYAVSQFADLAAPIQDAGGIPRSTSGDAIAQMRDKLGRARQYRQDLATAVRLFVRDRYGVTLPDGFDPLNPDLGFITDPWLKNRIRNAIAGYLADFFRDNVISPLWVNGPRREVDRRHGAFEDFVTPRVVSEPPGLAAQMQRGRDRLRNVVESDAIVTLGPYNILGYTLRYDLTLQEQENKRQQMDSAGKILKVAIAVLVVVGVIIILLLIIGAIGSGGTLAAVVGPIIWKLVKVLFTISNIHAVAAALLVVSMLFTVPIIAPRVPQYHDETLDAAESLIGGSGSAGLRAFDVAVEAGQARLTAQVEGPETGQSQALVETALYSVDGRISHIVWAPLQIQTGQQATLSKEVPLAPGIYRAVTTLYTEEDVVSAPVAPFQVPGPEIAMSLRLEQPRLNLGQAVQAHVTLTNTNPISGVNDLTLILESSDGVNFDAWPVSLAAGATQRIDYTFTPTTTGAYVLRAWLGVGLNALAEQDAAYIIGSGPAIALNTNVLEVYPPGVTVTLPLTLTNVGDAAGAVAVMLQTVDRLRLGAAVFTTTVTADVPAGGMVVAEGIALPNASPGLYSVRLDLNGVPYDNRDFAVAATDTLFGLLTVGQMYPAVGQSVPVTATVRSANNTLTDATITVTVNSPTGAVTTLPMTQVTTGTYRGDYTPANSGTHSLELALIRANYRGVGDVSFLVAGSPTLLIPEVEGQPQAGEIRPLTVTVRSETGVPIPGATVVLSGTQEVLRGETDAAGQVVLRTFPPDGSSSENKSGGDRH
jgi:hypothetical protein